jgi:hypothetical protein
MAKGGAYGPKAKERVPTLPKRGGGSLRPYGQKCVWPPTLRPMGGGGSLRPLWPKERLAIPYGRDRPPSALRGVLLAMRWPKDGAFGRGRGFRVQNPPCEGRTRMGWCFGDPKDGLRWPSHSHPHQRGCGIFFALTPTTLLEWGECFFGRFP